MINIAKLTLVELLQLRLAVDARLLNMRAEVDKHWDKAFPGNGNVPVERVKIRKPNHSTKGIKVKPKYRGPNGETWAGRGMKPKWLVAAMKKSGKKAQAFLVDKSAL